MYCKKKKKMLWKPGNDSYFLYCWMYYVMLECGSTVKSTLWETIHVKLPAFWTIGVLPSPWDWPWLCNQSYLCSTVPISSLCESRKRTRGRQAKLLKKSGMEVTHFPSIHRLLRELSHMTIQSCKGSWEMLPLAGLPLTMCPVKS